MTKTSTPARRETNQYSKNAARAIAQQAMESPKRRTLAALMRAATYSAPSSNAGSIARLRKSVE